MTAATSLANELSAVGKKLREASQHPDGDPDAALPLLGELTSILTKAKDEGAADKATDRAEKVTTVLQDVAKSEPPLHQTLLAIMQGTVHRSCREAAAVALDKLLRAGYPFLFASEPAAVEPLLAALEDLLPDDPCKTETDDIIFSILLSASDNWGSVYTPSMANRRIKAGGPDYREVVLANHQALLHRAEALLYHSPTMNNCAAFMFLASFHLPMAAKSCPVGARMRQLSVSMQLGVVDESIGKRLGDYPFKYFADLLSVSAFITAQQNTICAVVTGRYKEVLAAIEEHLVPHLSDLVEKLTSSEDDSIKRRAASLIGCIFHLAHIPYRPNTLPLPPKDTQMHIDEVMREPVRVLLSNGSALQTMATLLGSTDIAIDLGVGDEPTMLVMSPAQQSQSIRNKVDFGIAMPLAVARHLSDPALNRDAHEHVHALVDAGYVKALVTLLGDDRLFCVKAATQVHCGFSDDDEDDSKLVMMVGFGAATQKATYECLDMLYRIAMRVDKVACDKSVVRVLCDLLAKHARGEVCIKDEDFYNTIVHLLTEFVAFGDRQVERGKIATNVFRTYVFNVLKNFRDLLEEPDKLKQFRAMQRRLEAARHIAPVPK
ncbi:unnamed protein product [Vitrella brassicaformis CCMP3155]|uniref:Uncharacterized protein n=2 Tax=Vitrella brassicaformis TaxID=1169539 RepID=A0A0G4GL29_VITBC|nr:unnamed protein product [Vitrella brassicaformis CCMP3155]|eukprot:CEM30747.1 unnamed protein product [Vitrella brassicaformis CCMP3155]